MRDNRSQRITEHTGYTGLRGQKRHNRDKDQSVMEGEHSVTGYCQRPRKGCTSVASESGESQERVRSWRPSLMEQDEAVGGKDAKRGHH